MLERRFPKMAYNTKLLEFRRDHPMHLLPKLHRRQKWEAVDKCHNLLDGT